MTIKKRILSLLLALVMLAALLPPSMLKSSAAFSGALQFDTAGKFTVMQIADIQSNTAIGLSSRVITLLENAIARYQPDLCVFTGDNQTGGSLNYKSVINKFLAPLIDTNTKFAVTFGNHEEDGTPKVSKQTQYDYYMSRGGNNAVDHDIDALSGVGSGAIPIYPNGQASGTPAFQVYLMDSGMYASSGYDCPYTDQVDYYVQRSLTYPNVPSLWYMHIIVPDVFYETMTTVNNGTQGQSGNGSAFGSQTWYLQTDRINWAKSAPETTIPNIYKELPCPANESTYTSSAHRSSPAYGSKTLYESWVAYGNMLGTYYGHDHKNSFVTTTDDGIDIGYGKAPTLASYNDGNPGLRIFQLDVNGTYTSESVTEADLAKAMVSFDANGGTGDMSNQYIAKNSSAALKSNTYTRNGYSFAGWSTSPSGGVSYADGANITVGTADIKLYAQWEQMTFINIAFDANGGSGGTGPTPMIFGTPLTAPAVTRTGYTFNDWQPHVPAFVPSSDTTFTAQWSANTYTVHYDANGGSGSTASSSHTYDTPKTLTNNGFSKPGYSFTGWASSAGGLPLFADGDTVMNLIAGQNDAVTLYAVWKLDAALTAGQGVSTVVDNTAGLIYGLEPGITGNDFANNFVEVVGDARLVVTQNSGGFGTGTTVDLVDNTTGDIIASYTILIFGDVNGDGTVDSLDAGLMVDVENYLINWDDPAFGVFRQAGDLNGDGKVDAMDAGLMVDFENYLLSIDQAAGTVV